VTHKKAVDFLVAAYDGVFNDECHDPVSPYEPELYASFLLPIRSLFVEITVFADDLPNNKHTTFVFHGHNRRYEKEAREVLKLKLKELKAQALPDLSYMEE